MTHILQKYARLLVQYCLQVKDGDKVFISTTLLAEPLLREVYREAYAAGAALAGQAVADGDTRRLALDNDRELPATACGGSCGHGEWCVGWSDDAKAWTPDRKPRTLVRIG